ncbi:hypothetical protein TVAG_166850 [Trichomonas vaginalis G3]|uniref:Bap-like n=1 Tax=Trichomonas vaginalis (strain ATCC PRA-98 / G3) TaxID=412133 RepID=A2DE92_TRIV3|nr:Listeria-Bacteroides repeat domain (List Bact rpt) family [Trichomonas vaginalis G3]EAY21310.1 hypothetical protein TVAG_166850 [Trichomonas vaginalis G3]KAI5548952.1 Listeria-Bacteroides repeat domain (List Bact rpt) family [Trichomonas vaginalis G3]|eukprot:XP_001582296.1 hypothetical protein [Trichomonas vaginalis G3]
MLPLFYTLISSDDYIVKTKYLRAYYCRHYYYDPWTDINIQYNERADSTSGGERWVPTTYSDGGWFPIFKVDDDPTKVRILGSNRGVSNYKGIYASTNVTYHPEIGEKYLLITYSFKNQDTRPHTLHVASHTDVQIRSNDRATCKWYYGKRGLTMKDPGTGITLTLLIKGGYHVTDVDTFWFGRWQGPNTNLHYFDNYTDSGDNDLVNTDSAFSIGWLNRHIYPNETLDFSVLLGVGANLKNPAVLTVNDNFADNNMPNQEITVTGTVNDFDPDENVTVYYQFNGGPETKVETFPTGASGGISNGAFSFKVTLGPDVAQYPLKVYARDSFGLTSNVFEKNLLVNEIPRLVLTRAPPSTFFTGGTVILEGTIWDDRKATLKYQVDNGYNWNTGDEEFVCNRATKPFRKSFPIQEDYINYGHHVIKIWAQDDFGVQSEPIIAEFDYVQLHAPEMKPSQAQTSIPEVHVGKKFTISGQARDIDSGERVSVYYKYPEDTPGTQPRPLFTFDSNTGWQEWEIEYEVPDRKLPFDQEVKVILYAEDTRGGTSADLEFKFIVKKVQTIPPTPYDGEVPPNPSDNPNIPDSSYSGLTATSEVPTIVCEEHTDVNGDTYTRCDLGTTYIVITTDATPAPTQSATPSASPEPGAFPEEDNAKEVSASKEKSNKKKMLIIGLAAGGVAAAAVVAAAIIIHEATKAPKDFVFNEENGEFMEVDGDACQDADNPIYDENGADDPFANEFDEDDGPVEGIFPA